ELPEGDWQYEPKWDGFRGVLENDGGELALWSRNGRPLLRYFPELGALGDLLPPHSALDGEIVIERDGRLEFDALQLRLHPAEGRISTVLLGLYDEAGKLDFVGHASGFPPSVRRELEERLPKLVEPGFISDKRIPGGQSRWSRGKELDWNPVRPELVVEVRYDKLQGDRFRHGTGFVRFRPDKDPDQCTWDQVRPRRRRGDPTVHSLLAR